MTLEIQVLLLNFCLKTFENMSVARSNFSSPPLLFCSSCMLFCHMFFTSLSVTPLLYRQPLKGILGIMRKNSTAFLSIIIAEILDQEYQRIQLELTIDLDYRRTLSHVKQLLKQLPLLKQLLK